MRGRTPIRAALVADSDLAEHVEDGIGAVKKSHRSYISAELRPAFADSLDIDEAFRRGRDGEHRWDYLLGHAANDRIYALEPHSAHDKEVIVVIKKRERAKEHLKEHLREGVRIAEWFWVASGKVDFTAHDKTTLQLSQHGITFVGKQLLAKRLGTGSSPPGNRPAPKRGARRK